MCRSGPKEHLQDKEAGATIKGAGASLCSGCAIIPLLVLDYPLSIDRKLGKNRQRFILITI